MRCVRRCTGILTLIVCSVCLLTSSAVRSDQDTYTWTVRSESGWLGVSIQDLTTALKEAMEYTRDSGVLVNDVDEGSPAEKAGIQEGDIIIEFNGKQVDSTGGLIREVRDADSGDEVKVVIVRKGQERTLTVTLGDEPSKKESVMKIQGKSPGRLFIEEQSDRGWLGVHLQDLTEQLGDFFGVKNGEGALVTEVVAESPAEKAGLRAGDVVVKYEGDTITDVEELVKAVGKTEAGDTVEIRILRGKRSQVLQAEIAEPPDEKKGPSVHFYGLPVPEGSDNIGRYHDYLHQYWKDKDWDESLRGERMDVDEDLIRELQRKIEKLERDMAKMQKKME